MWEASVLEGRKCDYRKLDALCSQPLQEQKPKQGRSLQNTAITHSQGALNKYAKLFQLPKNLCKEAYTSAANQPGMEAATGNNPTCQPNNPCAIHRSPTPVVLRINRARSPFAAKVGSNPECDSHPLLKWVLHHWKKKKCLGARGWSHSVF